MRLRREAPHWKPTQPPAAQARSPEKKASTRALAPGTSRQRHAGAGDVGADQCRRAQPLAEAVAEFGPGHGRLAVGEQEAEGIAGVGQLDDPARAGQIGQRRRLRLVAVQDQREIGPVAAQARDQRRGSRASRRARESPRRVPGSGGTAAG